MAIINMWDTTVCVSNQYIVHLEFKQYYMTNIFILKIISPGQITQFVRLLSQYAKFVGSIPAQGT